MSIRVSIIVPVYNAEKYLRECVESVLGQTLSDIELILVDDGSTDGSPALCDRYAVQDHRVKVIHKPNGRAASARNAGLRAASGEYVAFVDADDWISPDMYEKMLQTNADVTLATIPVPMEEASRFGVVITDENKQIQEFEEKPEHPRSNLASMGIYIFSWPVLREALIKLKDQPACDFGKHIIPYCHEKGDRIFAYEYNGYWKDVGTLGSYWESNMELIDLIPVFNLYEEFWKIYTKSDRIPPQYIAEDAIVDKAIIGEASEIYGEVHSSVIGSGVTIEPGAIVRDSIIMSSTTIKAGTIVDKSIIAENVTVGKDCKLGVGEELPNKVKPDVYAFGLVTIGEDSVIPDGVQIGKNTAIKGVTEPSDYPDGVLAGGETLIKVGDR